MPQLQFAIKQPVAALNPPPAGFTWTHATLQKTDHKLFSVNANGTFSPGAYGNYPPQRFFELNVTEADHNFSPGSGWKPSKIWGFDGQFPGPLFRETYGVPILVRYRNNLPSGPFPFGSPEITTHLHNGHTPTESDGHPLDFFPSKAAASAAALKAGFAGYKDQHYPNVYAGFSTTPRDPKAPADGDPNEALASLWYHDHRVDFTAANVVHGLAGFYNLFDHLDTGDENTGLRLPSGPYDVPIMFFDPAFDPEYQGVFDVFNTDGVLGDKFTANGIIQPKFAVKQRRYRLRLLNIGRARWYEFWVADSKGKFIAKPFWQISSDGNLLPFPLLVDSVRMSVAERPDMVIDFNDLVNVKKYSPPFYLVNRLEQTNGRGPTGKLLPFSIGNSIIRFDDDGALEPPEQDNSLPLTTATKLRPLNPLPSAAVLAKLTHRRFKLERGNGAWQINGKFYEFDAAYNATTTDLIPMNAAEVWTVENGGGGWAHPAHIHYEEHRVITLNGKAPPPAEAGRKDVSGLGPKDEVTIYVQFRDTPGRFVQHCHNVVHEDHAMMADFQIVDKKGAST